MKAVVYHGPADIRLDDVPDPTLQEPHDAIVRLTASAICGTDLHFVRGTMSGTQPGRILGHEGVGVVEEVGPGVRNLRPGDRVVIASTIACGFCSYCRAGYFAQCDTTRPAGGTAFFGGPEAAGGCDGLQAEFARVPYANVGCVKLPDEVTDEQAIMLSDIFPTALFGADLARVSEGDTVAVLGAGPVGVFAVLSAFLRGASRVLCVDRLDDRLDMARDQGAETINFDAEDAAPTMALRWAVRAVAKAGTIGVIGVYPPTVQAFPIGEFMNKNLTMQAGNCNHRRYIPHLVGLTAAGRVEPDRVLTQREEMVSALDAYAAFDARQPGWMKVELTPAA